MNDPATWEQAVWSRLLGSWQAGRLGHGLLFCGPPDLGQAAMARRLAAYLLCPQRGEQGACGQCRDCRLIAAASHPDLRIVTLIERDDGKLKTEIGIDQIRGLASWFALTPQYGQGQVAVLDPCDRLNAASANAVLKTLEEPASGRYLLLVCDQPQRLPATVRSRCQRIEFALPPAAEARDWLLAAGASPEQAARALLLSDGHPVWARRLLQEGGLARVDDMLAGLDALAAGRQPAYQVARRWMQDEPLARLHHLSALVRQAAWQQSGAGLSGGLTGQFDLTKLAGWSRRIDRVRALMPVPLRHELLLTELLQEWRGLAR